MLNENILLRHSSVRLSFIFDQNRVYQEVSMKKKQWQI